MRLRHCLTLCIAMVAQGFTGLDCGDLHAAFNAHDYGDLAAAWVRVADSDPPPPVDSDAAGLALVVMSYTVAPYGCVFSDDVITLFVSQGAPAAVEVKGVHS